MTRSLDDNEKTGLEIAVIGMGGRFPGANHIDDFWENLKQGVESIAHFSEEELIEAGVDPDLVQHSNYVKAKGYIEDVEKFDASFFSYSPREAEITDPQIRILQEIVWEGLEMAGYDPKSYPGLIGLYVGAATNFNWMKQSPLLGSSSAAEFSEAGTLCYKDALSTLTSYKLGLKGPSFTLYTACSTSLLSVHLASRALLTGECSIAVAGGVRVSYPTKEGYLYEEGMTSSPDGKVRAFDAAAKGAVFSDGAGIVVLKRLEDALEDGDTIHAIIKGSAANNDGERKVGYTAPSVEGQAEVIRAAHGFAEIEPESISYIETHGTATALGDTIEFEAIKRAFSDTKRKAFCGIGSVKSNVGHLDTAAGVTGLIKTILSLKHKQLPPSLHFNNLNPKIDFVDSPVYLNRELSEWRTEGIYPRRAGVSAFGFGGTNVHVVLEECPKLTSELPSTDRHLLVLSARSEYALAQMAENLATHCEQHPEISLADLAYTLQIGRREFPVRRSLVVKDTADAIRQLRQSSLPTPIHTEKRPVVYLLPDNAKEAVKLALALADGDGQFPRELEEVLERASSQMGFNLTEAILSQSWPAATEEAIVVAIGVALSTFLHKILPAASLVGFGVAELAAAAVAGVFELEDALTLATTRQQATLERHVKKISYNPPKIRFLSNVTGDWITAKLAMDPLYWAKVAVAPPAHEVGMEEVHKLLNNNHLCLHMLELPAKIESEWASEKLIPLTADLSSILGCCWEKGAVVKWEALYEGERRLRIPLPTYPFEKRRYWLEPKAQDAIKQHANVLEKRPDIADWFYRPIWGSKPFPANLSGKDQQPSLNWLLFVDKEGVGQRVAEGLQAGGHRVITVACKSAFAVAGEMAYAVDATKEEDYHSLFDELRKRELLPDRIVHLWNVSQEDQGLAFLETGFYSMIHLAKALSVQNIIHPLEVSVVTNQLQKVCGDESVCAEKQPLLAPVKILPQEYPNVRCRSVDIELTDLEWTVSHLLAELQREIADTVLAYRGDQQFISTFELLPKEEIQAAINLEPQEVAPRLRERSVYLITGGLGGIGLKLAEYLARSVKAKLVLIGRHGLPERSEWEQVLATHGNDDRLAIRIRAVLTLEQLGAEVLVLGADVADSTEMRAALLQAEERFGAVQGVIHAAGVLRVRSAQCVMATITREDCEEQFRPKLHGLMVLEELLGDRELDFCLFVSSLSPILGGLGFVAYAGANLYMDGVADRLSNRVNNRWVSVNWGDWQYTGEAYDKPMLGETLERLELTAEEGIKTFQCVLALSNIHRVIISAGDMFSRYDQWITMESQRQQQSLPSGKPQQGNNQRNRMTIGSSNLVEIEASIVDIWQEFYRVDHVEVTHNFFDLGATSLDIIQIHGKLINRLERHIPIDVMFEHATIRALATYLSGGEEVSSQVTHRRYSPGSVTGDIAIVGIAGRFPGAQNIGEYWDNLTAGMESIRFFSNEELLEAGVPEADVTQPNYVKAKGYLEGVDRFDAAFFDYTPQDAVLMDPQLRIFHEVAWDALEHAGYEGETYPGRVGVYAGASPNLYWQVLSTLAESSEPSGQFLTSLLNDKDSLTTQISYRFNLKGPSTNIFTGCSTSLVAIHTASQALLNGHCEMALAGGVTLALPDKSGYIYQEGMLFSADGHCKPFDEKANGMLFGDGVGVVVLKRLDDALADGDTIHGVIKGSAINNDGSNKIGYTAPSVEGQVDVIQSAHVAAGIDPDTISYIETHGTATKLGDTIEVKALGDVFGGREKQSLPIGSVKSNVGHLNAASGVAGLVKTVLAMQHRQLPASLNFDEPNKAIDFANSPFYVNTKLKDWDESDGVLRAGVSSFGIGGTNAHVVLEEAPDLPPTSPSRPYQVLLLSAKTEKALERMTANLGQFLEENPEINLADTAYTLQVGRKEFTYRRALLASSAREAAEWLQEKESRRIHHHHVKEKNPKIAFLFAGNGSQYSHMGRDLYTNEPIFQKEMDKCFAILHRLTGQDFKAVVFPREEDREVAKQKLLKMEYCQPLILSFEYALAALLQHWGIAPSALLGYSFGEYVAACLAGVFTLEEALNLIVIRGRLMSSLPGGGMLSVPLEEETLLPMLEEFYEQGGGPLSLSIVNGPSCIVAGSPGTIQEFEKWLRSKRLLSMRVTIEGAAHSHLLEPIMEQFAEHVRRINFKPPISPYISCITGTWITKEQAVDPDYWVRHMRETVRFDRSIETLKREGIGVFIEIGPGRDLSVMVQRSLDRKENAPRLFNTTRPEQTTLTDDQYLLNQMAQLWTVGVSIDWKRFYEGEKRRRIPLPSYSFEPVSHKLQGNPFDIGSQLQATKPKRTGKNTNLDEWFYVPQWTSTLSPQLVSVGKERWLIFADRCGLGDGIATHLRETADVTVVYPGDHYSKQDHKKYQINPAEAADYASLLKDTGIPTRILHLWGVTKSPRKRSPERVAKMQEVGFYALFHLAKAFSTQQVIDPITLCVITNGVQSVTGEEELVPEKAPLLGTSIVLPQEYAYFNCLSIDVSLPQRGSQQERRLIKQLIAEAMVDRVEDKAIAYRGMTRFVQSYTPLKMGKADETELPLKRGGVYLITGGLGGIALILARHLVKQTQGTIVLTSRSGLPQRDEWNQHLSAATANAAKIRQVLELEELGGRIDVQAVDVSDREGMEGLVADIETRFGELNGVIHAAGIIGGDTYNLVRELTREDCEAHFTSKVYGLLVLEEVLRGKKLDFCLLMSSISAVLGGLGYLPYAASNLYMDAFVTYYNREAELPWLSVNWSDWKYWEEEDKDMQIGAAVHELSMTPEEGIDMFNRVLTWRQGDLLVHSPGDLQARIDEWVHLKSLREEEDEVLEGTESFHSRPNLLTEFIHPRTRTEEKLCSIWQRAFRVQQIGVRDDFLELGGDSLKAITIVSRIHKELNVEVSVAEMFNLSTIEGLANHIEGTEESQYNAIMPAPEKEYYELSSLQKRFYILHRLHPDSTSYNDTSVILLEGSIDTNRLEEGFQNLVQHHEIFRTTIEMVGDVPKQRIHPHAEVEVAYFTAVESEVDGIIHQFVRPFDFNQPPYLRIALIRLVEERHILVIDLHHIVTDGVSYDIFVRDFLTLYAGGELIPLRLQYKDYAEWQNSEQEKNAMSRHREYWIDQFQDEIPVLQLPLDFPRPETQNFTGNTCHFTLGAELTQKIRKLAIQEETTLFTVLLASYYVTLGKYSNQDDIVIGTPVTGRPHADLQNIIGGFINMLALRNSPQEDKPLQLFLQEVRDHALEAFEHQKYPYEDLILELGLQGNLSRNPLFDAVFVLQNMDTEKMEVDGLSVSSYDYDHQRAQFDLLLRANEGDDSIEMALEYADALFRRESMDKFCHRFIEVLEQITSHVDIPIREIKVKHQLKELQSVNSATDFDDFNF
ncbi:Acyl transferase domain-containing protein [Marininema mesophilum]|uniref:Phenolphthiocerol/phthiocerol polyketide synthase subunit E n=1 Tax=Marininema mesophilum TaxID=1048340 RepID=A0A1H2Q997_9BACL|nr:type I polyketide synthase [Marininema mesophilum]SDW03763.1 Acyl transferase domain-containing protein [Marininema mesophilum]